MIKKFLSAISLVFAFLFINLFITSSKVAAAELPEQIAANAGWGEKMNYWAIVNYGADYIADTKVTIDIQQEAIANMDVNSIAIVESGYSLSGLVHYERNISPEFASKIEYTLKNTDYGEKSITILLLREFVYNPTEAQIVDKITIKVDQKRSIAELTPDEILVIKENEGANASPYKVNVTLPAEIDGKGVLEDYVFKSVTYTLLNGDEESENNTLNALYQSQNNYYFAVSQNGNYLIEIEDIFGAKVTKLVTIDNLVDPEIFIDVLQTVTAYTKDPYPLNVSVLYFGTSNKLDGDELSYVEYSLDGAERISIKDSMSVMVNKNGVYEFFAETKNGSKAQLAIQIDNLDMEAPFVEVAEEMVVYTSSAHLFNPSTEVFVYDNISTSSEITITLTYYSVVMENGVAKVGHELDVDYRNYLYSVRDIIVRYRVSDKVGNVAPEIDSYVHSIDDTPPTIERTVDRKDFYINDPYPTAAEIEAAYGIVVTDNSIYEGSKWTISYYLDFSRLPVDEAQRLNKLGLYNIFIRAVDEAGNVSPSISLEAEVRQRLITIEAKPNQYIVYGDMKSEDIEIEYWCVTRSGEHTDCSNELLKGDSISGKLYVLNATYADPDLYTIYYDNIRIPSDLYYLEYGDPNIKFEIKQRTLKIIAHNKEKYYLDADPELTYEIDTRVCDENNVDYYNPEYRCTFAPNTGDRLTGYIERYMGEPPEGVSVWYDEASWSVSDAVWYFDEDDRNTLVPRKISIGTLRVLEQFNGGFENYALDFEEAEFLIKPKSITVYLKNASKIYGEEDIDFEIRECLGEYPIDGASPQYCKQELRVDIYRVTEGETVRLDRDGNYVDYYVIAGVSNNMNYSVEFHNAYLTILKRDISISVVGDLDKDGNPTGKYTIYYEDDLPKIEVYDSSSGDKTGLVNNPDLGIADKFSTVNAEIYTPSGELITDYVQGIGIYIIKKGNVKILDKDDNDAEYNYNVTFNPGELEVIKKEIWIKIIKDLQKIYGDDDKIFTSTDLEGYDDYVILEANGRFVIEITPTTLPGEDPYIPRDNEKMKYHLKREEGIYVGLYPISIEKLEGCENYDVFMYKDYQYKIVKRELVVSIDSQTIVYKETPKEFSYTEGILVDGELVSSLQYEDYLEGTPEIGNYRHVGRYQIGIGSITIYDKDGKDVSENYSVTTSGGILEIIQREVKLAVKAGQGKKYGNKDSELEFIVYYNGIAEEMAEDDYKGALDREDGEIPGYYKINWGTFELELNGVIDNERVANYLVLEKEINHDFEIVKRDISINVNDVQVLYGGADYNYYDHIGRTTTGDGLAYDRDKELPLIDGYIIHDVIVGNLEILGVVDGVGTYTISCESLRIQRNYNGEDVTAKYYNKTCDNGILTVVAREIQITPNDNQSKIYGESDPFIEFTCAIDTIIHDCNSVFLEPGNIWQGKLNRLPRIVNDVAVMEDVGSYSIGEGDLRVITPSGKPNYKLIVNSSKTFEIKYRTLTLVVPEILIEYGDSFSLSPDILTIEGDGLAVNADLGINDIINGDLVLIDQNNRILGEDEIPGVGTYTISGVNLTITNQHNYKYTFIEAPLIVSKKKIYVTVSDSSLSKVYGEDDPDYFAFTTEVNAPYTGSLSRVPGEDARDYEILWNDLNFGPNYEASFKQKYYFTILPRVIEVVAENSGKLYGTKDPNKFNYNYSGTIISGDSFYGSLIRTAGEEVGDYEIKQGSLSLGSNYIINYTPGIFVIRYADLEEINIYSLTNNQHQVEDKESTVQLYARFNEGADETNINDVVWNIVKEDADGTVLNWSFNKDGNNVLFTPDGIGEYVVSASYGGITGYYIVVVEESIDGNIYIRLVSGNTQQTLGRESLLKYILLVPESTNENATVQWMINGIIVYTTKVSDVYFEYLPNLGVGEYIVQAVIGGTASNALNFFVNNNNPPVITLNGDAIVYIEAKTGAKYVEQKAVVRDDIEGILPDDRLIITGVEAVNVNVIGTYYIRYDATDMHGNKAISVYRQVVVRDTTPPVVSLIGNKEITLLYGQPYVEYGATAKDNYDGDVAVTITNPVIIDKIGTYEVTYVAYDSSGNRGSEVRTVDVIDNISPLITLIGDEIVYVEVYGQFKDDGALVEDNVDGSFIMPATSFYYGEQPIDSIDTSRLGTYYLHYDYKDSAGNIGAGKVRIVIVRDSTPPVIVLNGTNPYIIRYAYPEINYTEPGAVARDNYDTYVPVTITGQLGNELGTYYLYYNAVDSHGNIAATVIREVIIVDIENPIISFYDSCPQYMTIEALYEEYDVRCDLPGYGFKVEDDYMEDLDELQKRVVVSGKVDNTTIGIYVIKYDVTDMAGNAAVTLNRYVEVVDTTAPQITLKCDNNEICGDDSSQVVEVFTMYQELGAIVYDRYDEYHLIDVKVIINHNINVNKLGEYTVTYNATDSNGNRAEPVIRTVYVKDTTAPVVTLIGDDFITIERGLPYVEYGATAIDNYDGPMRHVAIINAPTGMKLGKYEVVYRAIDSSGNVGEAIRIVDVVDTIPPVVLGVEDGVYYKEPVSIYFIPTLGTDEVLVGWLNSREIFSPHYLASEGEYDLLVRDDAGNETRIWFAIDTTPPLILGVNDGEYTNREEVEVYSNEKIKYFEYRYFSDDWVRTEDQSVIFTKEGTYRIYAVDMADNVSKTVLFVIDRTPPVYTLTGVLNKGITNTDVNLVTEQEAMVAVNSSYNIPTLYTFDDEGYYQVVIRDLAGNTVNLQFVINKTLSVTVNNKIISILSQHNAINTISISGKNYPRNSGVLIVMPKLEGGFEYVNGKLFSESEYQTLMSGGIIEMPVAGTDDTYMFAAFVVTSDELNKFETQTVEGDKDKDNKGAYILILILIIILLFFFIMYLKRRRREEEEEIDEETIYEDYD